MRIAIATCGEFPNLYEDEIPFFTALKSSGYYPEIIQWNDPTAKWDSYDAIVIRSTWDYFEHLAQFNQWLNHLESISAKVFNPVALMRWNLNKRYLEELSNRGLPILATHWVGKGDLNKAQNLSASLPRGEYVLKPAVSAGAFKTFRVFLETGSEFNRVAEEIFAHSDLMVQPFAPEISTKGEWSLIYFGGEFSHAVLKTPKANDFRVQFAFGGQFQALVPTASIKKTADEIAALHADQALYARIDGIDREGQFLVMEIELVEPLLFLSSSSRAADRFVSHLKQRL